MKNKGFTLIELLAVIVILAVLALIVSPVISGAITNAKLSSAARSLEGYAQAIELAEIKYQAANQGSVTKVLSELSIEAKSKNKVTINSIVIEDSGIVSSINATVDGYACTYNKDSGAECSNGNDNPLVALPYTVKNPLNYAEYNKQLENLFNKYNMTMTCYEFFVDCPEIDAEAWDFIYAEYDRLIELYCTKFYNIINIDNILSINFYNDGKVIDDAEVVDVSEAQDNSIKMYYKINSENPEGYDLSFVADHHDISFPEDSSYFFKGLNYLDILSFNNAIETSKVIDMSHMFHNTGLFNTNFTLDLGDKFDTSNVTDMSYIFYRTGYSSTVFTLNLGNKFDTSKVTDMSYMFNDTGYSSKSFALDLGNKFYTSNVTNMYHMFAWAGYSSTVFTVLDLGDKFDTSKVTDMSSIFFQTGYSSPVFKLDLGDKFDTSNVTDMSYMFSHTGYSSKVFSLNLGDKFDTSKVTNMAYMFVQTGYSSPAFTVLDLGDKFDTSKITDMTYLFKETGYTGMTSLNLGPKFINIGTTNSDMFKNTGKSGCVIKVSPDIYYSSTKVKLNSTSNTYITLSGRTFQKIS